MPCFQASYASRLNCDFIYREFALVSEKTPIEILFLRTSGSGSSVALASSILEPACPRVYSDAFLSWPTLQFA
ncbi:hypothetical protein OIDMADRAFT_17630 [Oidiodendron maius Zn]|uniref:Uncharacterized protein n=1 Tax=Oidiodendron maius (strain Zn) TaxID=913774 RepID=A0A0C3HR04_OIDMZ|nr:hypothetical protein OIDMADRAFT_17630 [Oidiodendron maius Zn]